MRTTRVKFQLQSESDYVDWVKTNSFNRLCILRPLRAVMEG